MKKMKKTLALVGSLACIACASVAVGTYVSGSAEGETVWQESAIEESYGYGESFALPQRSITVNGKEYPAEVSLEYPDGTVTTKETVVLNDGGVYTLRYVAVVDGKTYLQKETFTVDEAYVTCGAGSSAVYGKVSNQALNEPARALNVRLAQGDTLTFSQPIDLNSVTKNDVLIEMMAKPDVLRSCDFTRFTVTFTDVEDEGKYFSVILDAYGGAVNGNRAYVMANGNGQTPKGYYHNWAQGTSTLKVNESGTSTAHCFAGTLNANGECIYESLRLSYDPTAKAVYINTAYVIDFDSPECYPEGLWEGFSTGKVIMSVTADGYSAATANFNVYKAYGMNFQRNTVYVDKEAPAIDVETDYTEMPVSEVGGRYAMPAATAFDVVDGYVSVKRNVYFNYNSETPQTVETDGDIFSTDRVGYYAIVYTAADHHGNTAEEVLWVKTVDELEDPVVEISSDRKTEGSVGESIAVAAVDYDGGSGDLSLCEYVTFGEETLAVENGAFLPKKAGVYTVWYEVTDFVGQVTKKSYDVNVTVSSKPVFEGEAVLPKVFISGSAYVVPKYAAYDYTSGKAVEKVASCKVDGKTYQAGESFVPTVENNGDTVTLTFVAGGAERSYDVPCVIAWGTTAAGRPKLYYENYFYSADGTAVSTNTGAGLQIDAGAETSRVTFANKLYQDMFALKLKGVANADNFASVTVLLHDSVNPYEKVEVKFAAVDGMAEYTAGQTKYIDFDFSGEKSLELFYADGGFVANNVSNPIKETVYGAQFNGFSSGYVWVEILFEGVTGEAALLVEEVGNQVFGGLSTDAISPSIYMTADAGGETKINTWVTLPAAYAGDVLDPNVVFTVTVTAPDGSVILEKADPTKEHKIYLDEYGTYYVEYNAEDTFNRVANTEQYTYSFVIADDEAPVIKLDKALVTEAKVGDTYILPNYTVSDNLTKKENIVVLRHFVGPNGRMKEIPSDSNSIAFTEVGEYEIYIMVADEAGNVAFVSTVVTVKEA